MKCAVGVDIVDLTNPRARGRSGDTRFLDRVFSAHERERIRQAADPDLEIWTLWAAKEAGYKVTSKVLLEPPVFRHAAFEVADPPGSMPTRLVYRDLQVALGLDLRAEQVLVWAWDGTVPEILVARCRVPDALELLGVGEEFDEWLEERFDERERDAIHGLPSALVRLLARRDASRMLKVPEERLSITCPPGSAGLRPPYLEVDGARAAQVDISLSHDGRELAWAVRISGAPEG